MPSGKVVLRTHITQEMRSEIKQVKKQHVEGNMEGNTACPKHVSTTDSEILAGGREALGRRGHVIPTLRESSSNIINGPVTQQSQSRCSELFDHKTELGDGRTRDCSFTR